MKCPICGTAIETERMIRLSHRGGKNFFTYLSFIQEVKNKSTAIVIAPDYVVMDKATYNKLTGAGVEHDQ